MRRQSPKNAALYREHAPMRREFVDEMGRCAVCGSAAGLVAHEMTPGPNRLRAFGRRECLLAACNRCNCGPLKDRTEWPLAAQLWLKLQTDPEYFCLSTINEVLAPKGHPYPPQAVSAVDVLRAGRRILMGDRWRT